MDRSKLLKLIPPVIFGGLHLPFTRAFSGASVPAPFYGANLSMVGGKLTITPTLEGELFSDPGMEGTYTAGLDDHLSKTGLPTLAQSADVHGGTKAQEFTAVAQNNDLRRALVTVTGQWYLATIWAKRTAGAAGSAKLYWITFASSGYAEAAYTQKFLAGRANGVTTNVRVIFDNGTAFDTVIIDDVSVKPITFTTMLAAGVPASSNNVIVKGAWRTSDGRPSGIAICLDSYTNPQNGLFAFYRRTQVKCMLEKLVNGTWTSLLDVSAAYADDAEVEIRKNESEVSLYYNGAQLGVTQDVTDPTIINNKLHTLFSSSEVNTCSSFGIYPYQ